MHSYGADYIMNPSWRMLGTLYKLKLYLGAIGSTTDIVSTWIKIEKNR